MPTRHSPNPVVTLLITMLIAMVGSVAAAPSPVPPTPNPELTTGTTTVWVSPRQTVPLLNQPALGATTGATVASGDPLTLLAQQGEFMQVRTESGAGGWIRRSSVSDAAPAPASDLALENARLAEQARNLDAQLRAFQDESAQLRTRMQALEAELAARTRPVPLTAAGLLGFLQRLAADPRAWALLGVLLLLLSITFRLGVERRNKDIRERLGGLDL